MLAECVLRKSLKQVQKTKWFLECGHIDVLMCIGDYTNQIQCNFKNQISTQPIFTLSNSTFKTPGKYVKYVQSQQ